MVERITLDANSYHKKRNNLKNVLIIFIKVFLIFLVLLGPLFLFLNINSTVLSRYLEKSQKVNADLLIIEAWLPDLALELVKNEILTNSYDYIVTTGIESAELDFFMVAMNGYLIFYPSFSSKNTTESTRHVIEVVARSKMGGKYRSHFNLFVNDSLIAEFNADEKPRRYRAEWFGKINKIDSLMVQFTNDYFDESGDRNLYIKEFIIDNVLIIPYQFNSLFDIGILGGKDRIRNDYRSHPEMVRNKLIASGIESSKIFAVTGKRTKINRTLIGALAFRKWLNASGKNITGINIATMGIHARRTWLTYKRVIDNDNDIGIISLPESDEVIVKGSNRLPAITESFDLIYYWIILLPY